MRNKPCTAYPYYQKRLASLREKTRARRAAKESREKKEAERLGYTPPKGTRSINLCKGHWGQCRWLTETCLRPPSARPCPARQAGETCKSHTVRGRQCAYYRAACDRKLAHCPFGHHYKWTCERCERSVYINHIHFVREVPDRGLVEVKMRGLSNHGGIATALCSDCLKGMRARRRAAARDRMQAGTSSIFRLW